MARIKFERGERSPFEAVRSNPRAPEEVAKVKAEFMPKPAGLKPGSDLTRQDILGLGVGAQAEQVRVRFAPSPTGDLHIGGAYIALKNMMAARSTPDGKFFVRIEDTDTERSLEKHTQGILKALAWLNIKPDEEIAYQSQRTALYKDKIDSLIGQGKAYVGDRGAVYFKMPTSGVLTVNDAIRGNVKVDVSKAGGMGDYVIRRADGNPTFLLANTVDDGEQGINLVIRGVDHLTNAARQVPLFHALGYPTPRFFHVPLVHGDDGGKLSKRKGATSVLEFQKEGVEAEVMVNHLARLGYGYSTDKTLKLDELIHEFDPTRIGKSKSRIGYDALYARNQEFIAQQPVEQVAGEMKQRMDALSGDFGGQRKTLTELIGPNGLLAAADAARGRASTYQEAVDIAAWAMVPPTEYDERDIAAFQDFGVEKIRQNLGPVVGKLDALPAAQWTHQNLANILKDADKRDLPTLRWMATGSFSGLPLANRLAIYGKEGSMGRIHQWLEAPRPALPAPAVEAAPVAPGGKPPKFRFVVSPSASGLDVNSARTALQNYLAAKKLGGTLSLRLDDLNKTAKPEVLDRAQHDLRWLGIQWQGEPALHSARQELYTAKLNQLVEQGVAYRAESGAVMFRMREADGLGFEDHVRGRVSAEENAEILQDYPLQEADGRPSPLLTQVVDDGEEKITHVLRSDEQLTDALRERALARALGYQAPEYWHVRPVHDPRSDNLKVTVADLRATGAKPVAVANHLARLGQQAPAPKGDVPLDRLADVFDLKFSAESPAWAPLESKPGRYIQSATAQGSRTVTSRPTEVMKLDPVGEGIRKIRDHLEEVRRPEVSDWLKRTLQTRISGGVTTARPDLDGGTRKSLTEYEGALQRIALMVPAPSRDAFVEVSAKAVEDLVAQVSNKPERARRVATSVMAAAELQKGLQTTFLEGRLRVPPEALSAISVEDARQVARLTEAVDNRVGTQAAVTALPSLVSALERAHGQVTPELHAQAVRTAVDTLIQSAPLALDPPTVAALLKQVQAEAAGPIDGLPGRVRARSYAQEQGLRAGAKDALQRTFQALNPPVQQAAEPLLRALDAMLEQHRGLTPALTGAVDAVAQATGKLDGLPPEQARAVAEEAAGWVRGLTASPDAPALLQQVAVALATPEAIPPAAAVSRELQVSSLVPALQAGRGGDARAMATLLAPFKAVPYGDRLEAIVAEQPMDRAEAVAAALPGATTEYALSEPRDLRTFANQLGGIQGVNATPKFTSARLQSSLAASGAEVTPELIAKLNQIDQKVLAASPDAPLDVLIRGSGKEPGLAALANPNGGFLHDPGDILGALLAPLHGLGKGSDVELSRFAIQAAGELARLDRAPAQATAEVAQDLKAALEDPAALHYAPGVPRPAVPSVADFLKSHPALPPELALTAGRRLDAAQFGWLYTLLKGTRSRAQIRDVRDFVFGALASNRLDLLDAVRQAPPALRSRVAAYVAVEFRQGRGAAIPFDAFCADLRRGVDPVLELNSATARKAVEAMKLGDVRVDPTSDGPAQVQRMMPEITALFGVLGAAHQAVLSNAVRAALEGRWPAARYEDEVAKRELAGLKPEQVAAWRENKIFVPEAERAPLPDDAAAMKLFTALQSSVAKIRTTVAWRGGQLDLANPEAVKTLRAAYEANLEIARRKPQDAADPAAAVRERKAAAAELDTLSRALSFADLRTRLLQLAQDFPGMNREQRDAAWRGLNDALAKGRAGLSQFGNRDFATVSAELQQTIETVSERADAGPKQGTYVKDGDSLEEFLGSHYSGCLSAIGGANRHALMALLGNAEYKMGRVYVGDKAVARGVWRLYQADWPEYQGPVLAIDNLAGAHVGDVVPADGQRLFIEAALAKARAMGIPLVSPNPNLEAEAKKLGIHFDATAHEVIVDEGHSPNHQAEHLSVYWIPAFAEGKSKVGAGAMARTDLQPGEKPRVVLAAPVQALYAPHQAIFGEPVGNRVNENGRWVQAFEHGKIYEDGYIQLEGDAQAIINGKRDAYLRYREIVGRPIAPAVQRNGVWVQQCEHALVGDNGQVILNGQNFWLVNGKLNAYLEHANELGPPIGEAYLKDGVWVQDFQHGQADDNEQVRLNP